MLDGLEVMERKGAHHLLLERLRAGAEPGAIEDWSLRLERFLAQDRADREASVGPVFHDLALFAGHALAQRVPKLAPKPDHGAAAG